MLSTTGFAAVAADRWLLAFSAAVVLAISGGLLARRSAQRLRWQADRLTDRRTGIRRRAGILIAFGPLAGFALASSHGKLALVAALGAASLAVVGWVVEGSARADRVTMGAIVGAAAVAVAVGVRFGPTGVGLFDVLGAFVVIVVVTQAANGLGNTDGLAGGLGMVLALGVFAPAAFGHQNDLASVMAGLVGACVGFLAFNLPPASLFMGRAGRLAIGYVVAVGALALAPATGAGTVSDGWRDVTVPLILLGVLLLDAAVVGTDRLRRRRPLAHARPDHLVHRLAALGWNRAEVVGLLVFAQALLGVDALLTARAVVPVWAGVDAAVVVLLVVAVEASRGKLERDPPPAWSRRARVLVGLLAAALVVAVVPLALSATRTVDLMQQGRDAARRGLTAARAGDTITAQGSFQYAATQFAQAHDELSSPVRAGAYAVPFLASNARRADARRHRDRSRPRR